MNLPSCTKSHTIRPMPETEPEDENPAIQAYEAAKKFAAEGAYPEALERHEWFHHHALEHCPSLYGVRLSYALSAWFELGAKYPPALASLRHIRDQGADQVLLPESSDELFHEVAAINRALGENLATMTLFRELEQAWPDLAKRRFRFIAEEAFDADDELFLRHTPDLLAYGQRLIDRQREMVERLAGHLGGRLRSEPRYAQAFSQLEKKTLVDLRASLLRLVRMVTSSGKPAIANLLVHLIPDPNAPVDGLSS